MNKTTEKRERMSLERVLWEIQRAFYSFRSSPVLLVLLLQGIVGILISAKGAGSIYLDMIPILIVITLLSWLLTSVVHGNQKVLIYVLILLTVGTMLQCIFIKEEMIKNPEKYTGGSPTGGLQLQYLMALAAAILVSVIYYHWKKIASIKCCRLLFFLSVGISLVTLIFAVSVGNVRNWIRIGGMSIQTTEIVKLIYVFLAAGLLGTVENPSRKRIQAFYIISAVDAGFLAIQSEYGTLLLLLVLFFIYLFLFVPDIRVFLKTVGVMGVAGVIIIGTGMELTKLQAASAFVKNNSLIQFYLRAYGKIANRFIYWLHPEKDALGLGYQLLKARDSIVLGGWFGTSSVTELPVKTSDLVYPALIQRCGMIFALLVFIVFILMWLEGVKLFVRKQDRYHQAVAAGLVYLLFGQTLIIIGGSTGLCPLTGITLPFISSGGSSLVTCFMITGLLITISGNVRWKGLNSEETEDFFKESQTITKYTARLRNTYDSFVNTHLRAAARRVRAGGRTKGEGKGKSL